MHVELTEILRCPNAHAESPLVASATRQVERRILQGTLGCPVCGREYPIQDGVVEFRTSVAPEGGARSGEYSGASKDEAAVRLAAQLNLTEPGRRVLLCGSYAMLAPQLTVMFDAICLTCGVAPTAERHVATHASVLRVDATLPLAPSSLYGCAIDAAHVMHLGLDQILRLVRVRGRLVASADSPLLPGLQVLARDDLEWVAERTADVVPLKRAAR